MGFTEALAVRHSRLYDGQGHGKVLLTLIAQLQIGEPAEGEEPDPNMGWCVATQDYLAMALGIADGTVSEWTILFEHAGWIETKRFRDKNGRLRCHYRIANLEKIKEYKCPKDENGKYVRTKNENKKRQTA